MIRPEYVISKYTPRCIGNTKNKLAPQEFIQYPHNLIVNPAPDIQSSKLNPILQKCIDHELIITPRDIDKSQRTAIIRSNKKMISKSYPVNCHPTQNSRERAFEGEYEQISFLFLFL